MDLNDIKVTETKLYTTQEVADALNIPYMQVYRMVKSGRIKATNYARTGYTPRYKIRAEDVQAYLDSLSNPPSRA